MHLTLRQWIVILIAIPLFCELGLLWRLNKSLDEAEMAHRQEEHSKTVITTTTVLVQLLFDVGIAFIQFDARTNPWSEQHLDSLTKRIPIELKNLQQLVADNPTHGAIVSNVTEPIKLSIREIEDSKQAIKAGGRLPVMKAFGLQRVLSEVVTQLNLIIQDEQQALKKDPEVATRAKDMVKTVLWFGVALSVLVALALAFLFWQTTNRRLKRLMNNSIRLGKGAELAPMLAGNDEIAKLDFAFHNAANALNESARKQRLVIDNAVDVICSIDAKGCFTAVSPAASELWGHDPKELLGQNWISLVEETDVDRSLKWAEKARASGRTMNLENRVHRKDNSLVDVLWSGHWSDPEQSMFCVAHDITERSELERFKQQFVAMISHDLRTPLMAVQSTLTLLGANAYGSLSEKGADKVAKAEDNLRHTINLINNLLDLEKMEAGKIELRLAPTSLIPVLKRCAASVSPLAESKSIQIELPSNDVEVIADAGRISQVVINLLGNALKFSPSGSAVSVLLEQQKQLVKISVCDQGPGIPEDQKSLIFERFLQASTAEKNSEGTGLGLAICRAIVEAHNGTIGVESELSKGSTFWFCIPVNQT